MEIIILLVSYVLAPAKSRNVLRFFYVVVVVFFFFFPVQFLLLKYSGQQLLPT